MAHLDGAAESVWEELQDLLKNPHPSVFSMLSNLPDLIVGAKVGDAYDVPSIGALTINDDGSADATADSVSVTNLQLVIDREPSIVVRLTRRQQDQLLGGGGKFVQQIARMADTNMTNHLDRDVLNYGHTLAWDTAGTYWVNPGGLTITRNHLLAGKAYLAGQRGATGQYVCFMDSWCEAGVRNLLGFTATQLPVAEAQVLAAYGIEVIGRIDGITIAITNENPGSQARGQRTIATSAAVTTVSGTTHTYTVAAGHNVVPGNFITVAGHDADENISTAAAVTAVTATSIAAVTAATTDGTSSDAVGTITVRGSVNIMADMGHFWKGLDPGNVKVKIVELATNTGANMVISPLFGRVGRAGRVLAIGSPYASLTQA
jgi:hypothetical protein